MINKIYELFLDELDFIQTASGLALDELDSIKDGGALVEAAFRKFLKEVIGERFHVTHGYIFSALNQETSPQIDIIITDTFVPHCLKKFEYLDGLEVVPAEAVVAIIEVKRTLTHDKIKKSQDHLKKIMDFVPLSKGHSLRYLPGGISIGSPTGTIQFGGGNYSNPLIGIVGLGLEKDPGKRQVIINESPKWFIDIIFSVEGLIIAPKDPRSQSLIGMPCRNELTRFDFLAVANFSNREKNLRLFVAYLTGYLSSVTGRHFNIIEYFCK